MKGSKFLLAAIAEKLVAAYKAQIEEYQTLGAKPLELGISDSAPSTFEALCEEAKQGKLTVTTEFSNTAIYGIAGNVTFRVFHDFGHLIYNKEFTTRDEVALAKLQWQDIRIRIEPEWRELANVVYTADTVAQSQYEAEHGKFPEDQKAFVLDRLDSYLMLKDHFKL